MFCPRVGTVWSRHLVFRSPRPVPSASAHALSPVWTASSSASNTFWRTRTHRTSSAVMSRLRMASAAPMLPQRLRGKMGGWKVGIQTSVLLVVIFSQWKFIPWWIGDTNTKPPYRKSKQYSDISSSMTVCSQCDVLCRACSQECHGSPSSNEKVILWSVPGGAAVSAQRIQPCGDTQH